MNVAIRLIPLPVQQKTGPYWKITPGTHFWYLSRWAHPLLNLLGLGPHIMLVFKVPMVIKKEIISRDNLDDLIHDNCIIHLLKSTTATELPLLTHHLPLRPEKRWQGDGET
jgi:hypothetical protein